MTENLELMEKGLCNLEVHIGNALKFGIPTVVAANSFKDDTEAEVEMVREAAIKAGAYNAVVTRHWMEGGKGAVDLAKAVVELVINPVISNSSIR